jgi:DNA-binding transcriptional ArsR family regulator
MEQCCCRWCSVGDLVTALDGRVTQPTVSHHLAVLREAKLVRSRREGRQVFYTLDQAEVARCCRWLVSTFAPESQAALQLRQDITLHDTVSPREPKETRPPHAPKATGQVRSAGRVV